MMRSLFLRGDCWRIADATSKREARKTKRENGGHFRQLRKFWIGTELRGFGVEGEGRKEQ